MTILPCPFLFGGLVRHPYDLLIFNCAYPVNYSFVRSYIFLFNFYVEDYLKQQGTLPNLRAPPSCMEVLGDGRDEDHDLIWNMTDDKTKRACTLLSNNFNTATNVYYVLITLDAASSLTEESSTPLAIPLPRRAVAISNASTTYSVY